ncbi:MAG: NYN domain-containing protein [Acidimicrobiales bacterium]
MSADEERIALFLDYENLAIGARENLGGMAFDLKPVADALAERGRVVVRRAYADWLKFAEDGRMLTRHHVELIEIPQRMGSVRKNAADIKMAVDALEMCFERDYITTFVLGTGDSDFTPLVHKLREHNKQVIGLGVQMSTSALLPPACDEFLFYERLEGVEVSAKGRRTIVPRGRGRGRRPQVGDVGEVEVEAEVETEASDTAESTAPTTLEEVERLITQTLSGLERSSGSVRASSLKRAVLRKESTFSEADLGFRGFTELLRSLHERGVIELADSSSPGDPDVQFPTGGNLGEVGYAFELLASTVESLVSDGAGTPLSGLKTQLRRRQPDFSEKRFGFGVSCSSPRRRSPAASWRWRGATTPTTTC